MEYTIKQIQMKILDIFIEIDKICNKHHLNYFAIGGTCLGAVRHQGFIPWDDDMDIAMPRKDYETFKEIAKHEFPENLKIFDIHMSEHYECLFMKVHDINTTFIHKGLSKYPDRYTGIFVDIMPLDGIPDDEMKRKTYFLKLRNLLRLNFYRKYSAYSMPYGLKKKAKRFIHLCFQFLPAEIFSEKYEALQKKYDFETSKDLCYGWSFRAEKVIFSKADFCDYILMPFENYQIRCPIGYDNFLKKLYGNYMELPPLEKRIQVHDVDIIDLERPYTYYIEKD